jgi:hypothetical protein
MYVLLSNPTTSRGSMHARCTERELGLGDKKERTFYFATKEAESWQGFLHGHTMILDLWIVQVLQAILRPMTIPLSDSQLEPGLGHGGLCVSDTKEMAVYRASRSFSKFYSLNHRLESYLHKNHFYIFSFSNRFSMSHTHSKQPFSSFIFGQRKIRNERWLYLNNHLEKLLESSFSPKSLFLTFRKDIEILLELLLLPL